MESTGTAPQSAYHPRAEKSSIPRPSSHSKTMDPGVLFLYPSEFPIPI